MANEVADKADTLPGQGQSPDGVQSPSQTPPGMITLQEHNQAIAQERKRQAGINKQVTDLQGQLEDKGDELKTLADERVKLIADIDALASDDPNKFNLVKKEREVRELERQTKAELAKNKERIKKAEEFERKEIVGTIVADYKDADVNKLLRLCAKVTSEDEIRAIADELWARKTDESAKTEVPMPKPDSGKTSGGGVTTEEQRLKERYPNR